MIPSGSLHVASWGGIFGHNSGNRLDRTFYIIYNTIWAMKHASTGRVAVTCD